MIVGQSGHVERRIDFVCLSPHACGSGLVFFEHACFFTVECGPLDLASWKCRAAAARCAARVWGRWRSFLLYYALSISFFRFLRDLAGLRRAGWSVRAGGGALGDADGVWLVFMYSLYFILKVVHVADSVVVELPHTHTTLYGFRSRLPPSVKNGSRKTRHGVQWRGGAGGRDQRRHMP